MGRLDQGYCEKHPNQWFMFACFGCDMEYRQQNYEERRMAMEQKKHMKISTKTEQHWKVEVPKNPTVDDMISALHQIPSDAVYVGGHTMRATGISPADTMELLFYKKHSEI